MMETVSVKFQEDVLKKMDKAQEQHNFNSRTEFIREAIRDKLEELNKKDLIKEFLKLRGKAKVKTSFEEERKIKKEVSKELMKELDKRFGIK